MTEIVAAHLERVARELSEQLVLNIVLLYNGNHPGAEIIKEANKVVAAALAACAREEAKWWEQLFSQDHSDGHVVMRLGKTRGYSQVCEACERLRALERAVGEKA